MSKPLLKIQAHFWVAAEENMKYLETQLMDGK